MAAAWWLLAVLAACGDKDGGADEVDADGDGYAAGEDCDERDPAVHPGAEERCDNIDNDCDGLVDDSDPGLVGATVWYTDADGDGFGDPATGAPACLRPMGAVEQAGDCDDASAAVSPGAEERCDEVDNDCDGLADDLDPEGVIDGQTFFLDGDGDGYGDPAAPVRACQPPAGTVTSGEDCDDTNDLVHPGAAELCDGLDTDCDAATGEDGLVAFVDASGAWSDWSARLTGREGAPVSLLLDEPGALKLCPGEHFATLQVEADVEIEAIPRDAARVRIDASGGASAVRVEGEGLDVRIVGLGLTGGRGGAGAFDSREGGGLLCLGGEAGSRLRLEAVDIEGNTAVYGGGLLAWRCSTELIDTRIRDNEAEVFAGGAWLIDGAHRWEDSELSGNRAGSAVGGGIFTGDEEPVTVELVEVRVSENEARGGPVGGLGVVGGSLSWSGSTASASGALANVAAEEPAGLYLEGASFTAEVVDFGEEDGDLANDGVDIVVADVLGSYFAPDDASFECDAMGCGEAEPVEFGGTGGGWSVASGTLVASALRSSGWGTLEGFAMRAYGSSGCSVQPVVLSADAPSSLDTASWQTLWSGESLRLPTSEEWVELGAPRIVAWPDDGLAVGAVCSCSGIADRCTFARAGSLPVSAADGGLGTVSGFLSQASWGGSGTALYIAYFGPMLATRFDIVEL